MIVLANADGSDNSMGTLQVLLYTILWLGAIAVLAAIPIIVARRRGHRHSGVVVVLTLFCAVVAGASVYAAISGRSQWDREEALRVQSGYYDPRPQERPGLPWALWGILGGIYAGTVAWSAAGAADNHELAGPQAGAQPPAAE